MFSKDVPFHDFKKRIAVCKLEAKNNNLSGLIVWSRGGGTFDRFADVNFLANFYQQRCYLPDHLPLWSGRAHCALIIPVNGEPTLIVSSPEYRKDLIAIKDIRYSNNFIELCCEVLNECGMGDKRTGLIGGDVLTYDQSKKMLENLPNLLLIPSNKILQSMRRIKTQREIKTIERASHIGSKAMELLMKNVSADKTESEIIAPAIEYIISQGAVLYFIVTSSGKYSDFSHTIDFPGYDSCRKIESGDIFKVDMIMSYDGYLSDFGRTTIVGNNPTVDQREMLDIVTNACEFVVSKIKPGMRVSEICELGDSYLVSNGVSLSESHDTVDSIYAAYPPHWGHGLGMTWEKPYLIHDEDDVIQEGMYLAIEKALRNPEVGTVFYEQNILVTENGTKTLTDIKKRWYE